MFLMLKSNRRGLLRGAAIERRSSASGERDSITSPAMNPIMVIESSEIES